MAHIAVAGAGLLGRLLAWTLGNAGHAVEVFDPAPGPAPAYDGQGAAAFSAAGMLCPTAELDRAGSQVARLGWRSIGLWQGIAAALGQPQLVQAQGSLVLAHRGDAGSARRWLARCVEATHPPQPLDAAGLAALEPALHGAALAWHLPGEGQIDPPATMARLFAGCTPATRWHWSCPVTELQPGRLREACGRRRGFDWVFDTRGLGGREAGAALAGLRGVRGETVWLHAPGHGLGRPVRLMHPRHAVYLVPRGTDRLLVGASEIEAEDRSPVSLQSAVELMAAAHSVLPALAEARIERLDRNLRPALADHLPHTQAAPGLVRINGLFRHGWLVAPAVVHDALHACGLSPRPQALPETCHG